MNIVESFKLRLRQSWQLSGSLSRKFKPADFLFPNPQDTFLDQCGKNGGCGTRPIKKRSLAHLNSTATNSPGKLKHRQQKGFLFFRTFNQAESLLNMLRR